MPKKQRWLEPNLLSDEEKEMLARVAREKHMTIQQVIEQLEVEQEKAAQPKPSLLQRHGQFVKPPANTLPKQQRIDPKAIIEQPDPVGQELGYEPRVLNESPAPTPEPVSQPDPQIDPRLLEIIRAWPHLTNRDREELVLILRIKLHLGQR